MKVLVVGGSGGIGSEIVKWFVESGDEVVAPTHRELDVGDEAAVRRFCGKAGLVFDALVYSAGINELCNVEDCDIDVILKALNVNALGFVSVARNCIRYMKSQRFGRIVAINSLYGIVSRKKRLPYSVSKHALAGAVKTMALEVAHSGILVNSVSPGFVRTAMTEKNNGAERIAEIERGIPVGRMGTGREIAEVVGFLCSKRNTYVTGQNIVVDGGYLIGGWQDA